MTLGISGDRLVNGVKLRNHSLQYKKILGDSGEAIAVVFRYFELIWCQCFYFLST